MVVKKSSPVVRAISPFDGQIVVNLSMQRSCWQIARKQVDHGVDTLCSQPTSDANVGQVRGSPDESTVPQLVVSE